MITNHKAIIQNGYMDFIVCVLLQLSQSVVQFTRPNADVITLNQAGLISVGDVIAQDIKVMCKCP